MSDEPRPQPKPVEILEIARVVHLPYITYVDLDVRGPLLYDPDKEQWEYIRTTIRRVPVHDRMFLWEAWKKENPRRDRQMESWLAMELLPIHLDRDLDEE